MGHASAVHGHLEGGDGYHDEHGQDDREDFETVFTNLNPSPRNNGGVGCHTSMVLYCRYRRKTCRPM